MSRYANLVIPVLMVWSILMGLLVLAMTPRGHDYRADNYAPCPTEDYIPTGAPCYWDGGDNGRGDSFVAYPDGSTARP